MRERLSRRGVCGLCGVLAEVVDDSSSGRKSLRMVVEAETGEFSDAKLFAKDARSVVRLERPIFDAAFDTAGAIEQRSLRGFEELLRARKQRLSRVQKLKLFAK